MRRFIIIMTLTVGLCSCKKFLSERSQTDVVPKTAEEFGEILYTNGYPTRSVLCQPFLNLMDDDVQCYNSDVVADQQGAIINSSACFQWQPDFIDATEALGGSAVNYNSWATYYELILGTNVALHYLDNSSGTVAEKTMYKGEAYALRAFYHFMLVNLYARPYNDSTTTPDKSPGVPIMLSDELRDDLPVRASVKAVYDQVTRDLDSATYLLEQVKGTQEPFRISHVAAHLLASRVYLYMEQWDKAVAHANYVLSYHPELMDLNGWGDPDPDNKPIVGKGNVEMIWYYGRFDEDFPAGVNTVYDVSHDLANCFESNDLRALVYMNQTPDFLKFLTPLDYADMKGTGSAPPDLTQMGCSWRSSEAYLNRAEANIQLYRTKGDATAASKALDDLNALRAKRIDQASFQPWGMHPADSLLEMCRTERRRELFREGGHRWFDLRRYGMPAIEHIYMQDPNTTRIYKLAKRDPQYVIPIPNNVLQRNISLGQNPQLSGTRQPE